MERRSERFSLLRGINARTLSLHQLLVFCSVVEHRNISSSARSAYMSQPAVSHLVRSLEDTLGVPLLHRHASGVLPTKEGCALYAGLLEVLGRLERTVEQVHAVAGIARGHLVIANGAEGSQAFVAAALRRLQQRFPGLTAEVVDSSRRAAWAALEKGEADVGIVVGDAPRAWRSVHCYDDEVAIVACPDHPLAKGGEEPVGLGEVVAHPIVLPAAGSPLRQLVTDSLQTLGHRPRTVFDWPTAESSRVAAEAGLGVAFLPLRLVRGSVDAGRLRAIRVDGFSLRFPVHAIVARGHRSSSPVVDFLRIVGSPAVDAMYRRGRSEG